MSAAPEGEVPHKLKLKVQAPPPGPDRTPSAVHDVHALLRDNLAREQGRPINQPIVPKRKKSRRRRDFLIALIGGNLAIVLMVALVGPNPISLLYGLSGITLLSVGLTWILFFVMDDY
jgi:hypothetical protein